MSSIQLNLLSTIAKLPNKEFMHLYLQMMLVVKKYLAITNNEHLQRIYENMQDEEVRVKQLEVKLNVPSEALKRRNAVHKDIKNSVRYLKLKLESDLLSPSVNDREKAKYIAARLLKLLDQKRITSTGQTSHTIQSIEYIIDNDANLANALLDLGLMTRVEILYRQGEEFTHHHMQRFKRGASPVINKKAIRKEAAQRFRILFITIETNYSDSEQKDEVWVEMADEVRGLVTEATSEK